LDNGTPDAAPALLKAATVDVASVKRHTARMVLFIMVVVVIVIVVSVVMVRLNLKDTRYSDARYESIDLATIEDEKSKK
jgi:signal transduction histidine kinase